MAGRIDGRLEEMGIKLPNPASPAANYVPYVISGSLVFIAGQIPFWNGEIKHVGKVGAEISLKEAKEAAPEECCGLILKDDDDEKIIWPAINYAQEPEVNFVIKINSFIEAQDAGEVIGVYHSHSKGGLGFSEADTVIAQKLELVSILYELEKDQFHLFEPEESN